MNVYVVVDIKGRLMAVFSNRLEAEKYMDHYKSNGVNGRVLKMEVHDKFQP